LRSILASLKDALVKSQVDSQSRNERQDVATTSTLQKGRNNCKIRDEIMKEANTAEPSGEEETEHLPLFSQYLNLKKNSEPCQLAKESQEAETEQQRIISDLKIMNLDPKLTCAREWERNSNLSENGYLCCLIPISKLKNLPQNLSGNSNIMSGDNSDKEGDPDQEYARKKYSYMCCMLEEKEIELFSNDSKRISPWKKDGDYKQLINQSSTITDDPEVDVYLQCEEISAFNFYCNLGFQQVNTHNTDGFDLIPGHIQDYFKQSRQQQRKDSSSFCFNEKHKVKVLRFLWR
jgi:hypothetical protein